jgi:environmental stress-induced protein Ves
MAWKNGGGSTREYFREPGGDAPVDWRLSVAEVAADGPFSSFEGLRRVLVLLSGNGMRLAGPHHDVVLRAPLDTLEFDGEAVIAAHLLDGATTDLNLMWRPHRWHAAWEVCHGRIDSAAAAGSDDLHVVFVATGGLRVDDVELAAGDAASWFGALPAVADGATVHFTLHHTTHPTTHPTTRSTAR